MHQKPDLSTRLQHGSGCSGSAAPVAQLGGLGHRVLWDKATGGPEIVVPIPQPQDPGLTEENPASTFPQGQKLLLLARSPCPWELALLFLNSWGARQDLDV